MQTSLDRSRCALVVIDVQERLAAAMPADDLERCVRSTVLLVEAAKLLGVPVLVTEQYPRGLGPTVAPLRDAVPGMAIEKLAFAATGEPAFLDALAAVEAQRPLDAVIVAGMEAHVCVHQTVRGLIRPGRAVHVPWDATCSRRRGDARVARELWSREGAIVTTAETIVFDLLGRAGTDEFRALSRLMR